MIETILVVLGIAAVGWLAVAAAGIDGPFRARPLQIALGVPWGLGIASCTLFGSGFVFHGLSARARTVDLVLLATLAAGLGLWIRIRPRRPAVVGGPSVPHGAVVLGGTAFGIAALAGVVAFGHLSSALPHGQWDAWAIWNMRARFLFRAPSDWGPAFALAEGHPEFLGGFGHPDYPMLLPLTVARFWLDLGRESLGVPRAVGATFALATVALLTVAVGRLRGATQGLLAGAVLLATPAFVRVAVWQYADVPLSLFCLAALVGLILRDTGESEARGCLVLAGAMAGFAAWTKNEGVLFCALSVPIYALAVARRAGWRSSVGDCGWMLVGSVPALAALVAFKFGLAPPNDLVLGQSSTATLDRLTDPVRHTAVARGMWAGLRATGGAWLWLLPAYAVLVGRTARAPSRGPGWRTAAVLLLALAAGYYVVYVVSPLDLAFHVSNSADRLVLALWPSALLLAFVELAAPGEPTAWERLTVRWR